MLVLGFPDSVVQARKLASALNVPIAIVEVHRFPDGESRLRLPAQLPARVVLYRSLDHPDDKLVQFMLAAEGARSLGAGQLTLVAPYLCYMRQDAAFHDGEVISQRVIGHFLAQVVDALITVDPHLHRVSSLRQAVPVERAVALSAAPAMGAFLAARGERPLLVGPDQESLQWLEAVSRVADLDYVIAGKTRRGDRDVQIRLPDYHYAGRDVVLVDDVASTGRTLAETARMLRLAGAGRIDVLVTHALFAGDAVASLKKAGVGEIWSSDSIAHATNVIELTPLLAAAVAADSV